MSNEKKFILNQTGTGKTVRKDFREERSFDKDIKTYHQKQNICVTCGKECLFIGLKNSRGQYKSFCCHCYSKLDIHFKRVLWCKKCDRTRLENIKMKNLERYYIPISYVVELLQKNCNYSPKNLHIEISNMLRIAKKRKDVK